MERRKLENSKENEPCKYILDKNLNPISLNEWHELYNSFGYVVIGKTTVKGYHISTLWTGITTRKMPFETVVFDRKGEPNAPIKHATEEEAENYHLTLVKTYLSLPEYGVTND
jgi:hypothetical protein